ncbi:MAG: methyltransferase domain-containing protein [Alcanivoracaceae bacterium]|nr:methyltransferase domain-containing protein [Alcanivoracaceae bacterium]
MTDLAVAKAFGNSAHSYDAYAQVQLATNRSLIELLPNELHGAEKKYIALDIGAGTAPMARQLSERYDQCRWLALDISTDMLIEAKTRGRLDNGWLPVCADASALPLPANSVSLIYSSFALQWCASPQAALSEMHRVLCCGGNAVIAVPVDGTMQEFRKSWRACDENMHFNVLPSAAEWLAAAQQNNFAVQQEQSLQLIEHYDDVRAIGKMLKSTGAYRVQRDQPVGLMTPKKYAALSQHYDAYRTAQGLPVTWQVLFLSLTKI